jgi:hypothetical protein
MVDRPRGILSESDREYLRSPDRYADEYSAQSVHKRQNAIRQRVRNAVLDVPLLVGQLEDELLYEALESDGDERPVAALPALVELIHRYWGSEYRVEEAVREAIENRLTVDGEPVTARVSIELFATDVDEIKSRLSSGGLDAVTHEDLEHLWRSGELGDDEYIELVEQWVERHRPEYDDTDSDVARYETRAGEGYVYAAVNRAKHNVEWERSRPERIRQAFSGSADDSEE